MKKEKNKIVLQMKNVNKSFPGTLAVNNVSFNVYAGEVHALIGENGAGKSTLMKIISGSYNDYSGDIFINESRVELNSPAISKNYGIEMIYQELSLALPLSIAENLFIGRLPLRNKIFLDKKKLLKKSIDALSRVGLDYLNPLTHVSEISQHEAQLVEIAKALEHNPRILVMDEPTSALSREEVKRLFLIIEKLKQEKLAIVYISHHLPEIFQIADRVTVMRDAKIIETNNIINVDKEHLIEKMIGRKMMKNLSVEKKKKIGKEKLRVEGLYRYGFFHDISFSLREGEILGISGLTGAGRSELVRSIIGIDQLDKGEIYLNKTKIKIRHINESLNQGIAYVTEDRKLLGLSLRLTVGENILSTMIPMHSFLFLYLAVRGKRTVKDLVGKLQINPDEPSRIVNTLSGGNQQKVLLAKWLITEPQILILDEPTRGVDIGAKFIIHKIIKEFADSGRSVILISSDLPELIELSDRIVAMHKGHLIGEMDSKNCTEDSILLAINNEGKKSKQKGKKGTL